MSSRAEPKFYHGICVIGMEHIVPREKLTWRGEDEKPYIICPVHEIKVELREISQEDHNRFWSLTNPVA